MPGSLRRQNTDSVCLGVCVGPVARGTARGIVKIIFSLPPYWICPITLLLKVNGIPIAPPQCLLLLLSGNHRTDVQYSK